MHANKLIKQKNKKKINKNTYICIFLYPTKHIFSGALPQTALLEYIMFYNLLFLMWQLCILNQDNCGLNFENLPAI